MRSHRRADPAPQTRNVYETEVTVEEFDYIIVGAGSAGCILANRLTEDPSVHVLLVEAGGQDRSIYVQMPTALSIPMNMEKFNWFYETEPEPHLDNRRMHCPRGKVLGGSSSINGMIYVRGNAMDFENWEKLGAKCWSYADVLPYFRRAETFAEGGDDYRGADGPLHTMRGRRVNPLYEAFVAAGAEAGYGRTEDMNGYRQEGFGAMDMTIHRGRRWSTANAYIKPIASRPNLKIALNAFAERIDIAGNRADGLSYTVGSERREARARREVILCGGAINSPQLLMLSGIGPAEQLRALGIDVRVDLPGVGENLMDHLEVYMQQECTQPVSLYSAMNPLGKLKIGVQWVLTKEGLGGTNHFEVGGFIRSRAGEPWPDLQYHFLPIAISYDGTTMPKCHGYQAHVGPQLPKSRGWVRLASAAPRDKPSIFFNYMSAEDDWVVFRDGVRLTREIFAQPAFDSFRGRELAPGAGVESDEQIDAFLRANVESAYHPCGTCKMGVDRTAVVDPECRVHGIEALRVVDASIMPQITNGNLNAPTTMLAEKAADHIRGQALLPRSEAPFYLAPEWQNRQREVAPQRAATDLAEAG
ncbi:MAG: choline dehydrogenase [Alphaproteobacteria bacterium]|nr:choline dehydrogenase [Alphaproteobacteria bacterium]